MSFGFDGKPITRKQTMRGIGQFSPRTIDYPTLLINDSEYNDAIESLFDLCAWFLEPCECEQCRDIDSAIKYRVSHDQVA